MLISQNFRTAFRGLTANKLRSALTILGIVIGVAAVVALMAIGNGATSSITSRIESNGTNLITIMTARFRPNAGTPAQFSYLTLDDYQALKTGLANVAAIAPSYQSNYDVKQGSESLRVSVTGITEDYFKVNTSNEVELGRAITAKDRAAKNRIAVIGSQTAEDLFLGLSPLNKVIKINGVNFTIVGVLKEQDSAGFTNSNDVILIPLETGYAKLFGANAVYDGKKVVNTISLSAASAEAVDSVMTQAESILRAKHDLLPTEDSDFTISSQSQILDTLSSVTTTLTVFLGAIAGISLLVGRNRHHEHHAGLRHGAHARDRAAQGRRSAQGPHPVPVPGGDHHPECPRRRDRNPAGGGHRGGVHRAGVDHCGGQSLLHFDVFFLRGGHRPVLRTLSRLPGCQPAPHGSATVRVNLINSKE